MTLISYCLVFEHQQRRKTEKNISPRGFSNWLAGTALLLFNHGYKMET
jgi:hypothetical protein